jgi:uncharacterized iron-regulated protein
VAVDLADSLDEKIRSALDAANELRVPFDQEIQSDNEAGVERVQTLVIALRSVERELEKAFVALDLDVPEIE